MFPRPRYHAQKRWAGERGIEIRVLAGALARLLDEESMRGEGFGAKPRAPHPRPGRPYYGSPKREETGRDPAQEPVHGIGDPMPCPGVARPLRRSRSPAGTNTADWKRGGLIGAIPEALCGEAPKGHPMFHRRRTNRAVRRPMGEKPEKRVKRRAPRSSPWTKTAVNGSGDRSPDPLPGEQDPTGKTWEATRKSSSRRRGRATRSRSRRSSERADQDFVLRKRSPNLNLRVQKKSASLEIR